MRSKLIIILTIFFFCIKTTYASKYPHHQLGISYSTISGTGLGYNLELDRQNAFLFTVMPYYTGSNAENNLNLTIITGIEYQKTIYRNSEHKVYGFIAASLWYFEKNSVTYIDQGTDFEKEVKLYDKDVYHNLGLGAGYNYILNNAVSFNLNLGLQYQTTSNDSFYNYLERTDGSESFIGIGGGVGIFFHL
ncbi:MAG: hypothetical protein RIF34_04780 [Candidatus Kapaibacterium sp.]